MISSPYAGLEITQWEAKTRELIQNHPLDTNELYHIVIQVWDDIFTSSIGSRAFKIGENLFPQPQIMGFFLHELIALELGSRFPGLWRRNATSAEKDVVCVTDGSFSIEIKTSSSARSIYGNRSYAQTGQSSRKTKSGYYLAINFEKFTPKRDKPTITRVRFGWLDHEDWQGQNTATGQQARLSPQVERYKLLELPIRE
jgi:hypothetical protein